MPRVSQAHLDSRRKQILTAAWRCFARQGFHATSMQDVFAEAGLSAGAVYRYFPSKSAIVTATASGIVGIADEAFQRLLAAQPPPDPEQALRAVLEFLVTTVDQDEVDRTSIAPHVFSEALRDPEIKKILTTVADQIMARWAELAERWRRSGQIAPDADPQRVAGALYGVMVGFVMQRHLIGIAPGDYVNGITALITSPSPR